MENLARSYIEKRAQQARTWEGESEAIRLARSYPDRTLADIARSWAGSRYGHLETVAALLSADARVPISGKGEILAAAHRGNIREYMLKEKCNTDRRISGRFRRVAEKSKRIAQGLTRAAKRA